MDKLINSEIVSVVSDLVVHQNPEKQNLLIRKFSARHNKTLA